MTTIYHQTQQWLNEAEARVKELTAENERLREALDTKATAYEQASKERSKLITEKRRLVTENKRLTALLTVAGIRADADPQTIRDSQIIQEQRWFEKEEQIDRLTAELAELRAVLLEVLNKAEPSNCQQWQRNGGERDDTLVHFRHVPESTIEKAVQVITGGQGTGA